MVLQYWGIYSISTFTAAYKLSSSDSPCRETEALCESQKSHSAQRPCKRFGVCSTSVILLEEAEGGRMGLGLHSDREGSSALLVAKNLQIKT